MVASTSYVGWYFCHILKFVIVNNVPLLKYLGKTILIGFNFWPYHLQALLHKLNILLKQTKFTHAFKLCDVMWHFVLNSWADMYNIYAALKLHM